MEKEGKKEGEDGRKEGREAGREGYWPQSIFRARPQLYLFPGGES